MRKFRVLVLAMAAFAAGCASPPPPPPGGPGDGAYDDNGSEDNTPQSRMAPPRPGAQDKEEQRFSPVQILMRYDLDHDGKITKAELQAGLKAEFDAADTNHNGTLEMDEVRAVNDLRWKERQSAASPLVDWNGDGVVDFEEFAGAPRALFAQLDANGDGVLSAEELNPRAKSGKNKPKDAQVAPTGGGKGGPNGGGGQGGGGQGGGGQGGGNGGPPPGN